ncbi:pentapeptide repeat-containing protein [Phormidesmis priestleyi ULC007]|uniref:Pentapeptide repeat-containing protein n=1 Tax=Phormidesmis priestleyi ULC007 TaxID=1920490 RepID=A0A2T1DL47_9CYAN|nr:pentapeptide repeat-containing protein [Phormidesmis priestleyi]PSB21203.1 pentapeptide repeat-containing protein [Phormidesmis priestleyi ULC007]PZO51269.1 MAG: pentapeptide repeat-containing protein [Phormidesmis priestleyi]
MNLKSFTISAMLLTIGAAIPAQAENLDHVQQLIATKQCQSCDLSGAGLVLARLTGANLNQANLAGANLSQAVLSGANLSGANLAGASLYGADLSGAKLAGADLSGADLRGAFLSGADLTGVQMTNAALQGAIGLPPTVGDPEDFYRWALDATKQHNYEKAIAHFNQVIIRKSDHAMAYFGRAIARLELGDKDGAVQDSEFASTLFSQQGQKENAEAAQKLVQSIKNPPKERKESNGGLGQSLISVVGGLLQLLLFR